MANEVTQKSCRPKRFIAPNEGFTEQLIEYNDQLQEQRKMSTRGT